MFHSDFKDIDQFMRHVDRLLFPDAKIRAIVCHGIDNSAKNTEKYEGLLRQAEKEAHKFFEKEEFSSNPAIAVWREAFKQFKTK